MEETTSGARIEMHINGERIATGGVGPYGVLTAMLCWVRRNPEKLAEYAPSATEEERAAMLADDLRVDLSALNSVTEEHRYWPGAVLGVGDEVTLRILPPGPVDAFETKPPGGG